MNKKRIALVEIGGSHDECLLTQMYALKDQNCWIELFTTAEIIERNPLFTALIDTVHLFDFQGTKTDKKSEVSRLWRQIKESQIEKVVLNTAQGKTIWRLVFKALNSKIAFVGVIHTSRMFKESFTQKLISLKIKKYLVLSDFIKKDSQSNTKKAIEFFYPLDFPKPLKAIDRNPKHVVIIGGVETRRKDLDGFLKLASRASKEFRWTFLGKSDAQKVEVKQFIENLHEKGLSDRVRYFDGFVDQAEFVETIASASCILPLVHPNTPSADQYFRNQIPGAMNVSLSFKVPMLIHEQYANWTEIEDAAVYYTFENFPEQLDGLIANFESLREKMEAQENFNTEVQRKRYSDFILG